MTPRKYILAFGCSFTEPHNGWPYRLGQLINYQVINKGISGVGNFHIANQVYETIDTTKYTCNNSVVIVMWSGIDRVDKAVSKNEFYYFDKFNDNIKDSWLHSGGVKGFDNTKTKDRYWYNYYKTYHTKEDSYLQTLQHIIGVQEFLSNHKIPYMFLTYKDIFTDKHQKYKRAKNLENQVNWNKFHFHDGFKGCMEWCLENGFELNDSSHPYTEGYVKYAEHLIIKKEILTVPLSQISVNQVDYNKVLEEYNAIPYSPDTSLGKKTLRVHPFIRPHNINLPILVNRYGKSKYKLINGYHRFIQAQQNNSTNIKVQVLNKYLHHFV